MQCGADHCSKVNIQHPSGILIRMHMINLLESGVIARYNDRSRDYSRLEYTGRHGQHTSFRMNSYQFCTCKSVVQSGFLRVLRYRDIDNATTPYHCQITPYPCQVTPCVKSPSCATQATDCLQKQQSRHVRPVPSVEKHRNCGTRVHRRNHS